jgi:hypothetical protein
MPLGCHPHGERDAVLRPADKDGCAPDDFYSSTNQQTAVRIDGVWLTVERQRMDAAIVVDRGRAVCRKLRDVRTDDRVVCGVDGIRVVPGAGIVVDASRTLSTDTRWLYVNVRLLFNYVKSSLKDGLRWVRQEPNKRELWDAVKFGTVRPFLMGLWRQGAFGTGDPADVFTIVCDEGNNPPDEVDKGNFNLQVTFWPSKPAETIVIVVGQQPSASAASEA